MDIIKVIPESYMKQMDLSNTIRYVTNNEKTRGFIGGWGVTPYNPEQMIYQMTMVKKCYGREQSGWRQLKHIIASFKKEWNVSPNLALMIAYEIAEYYAGAYQICFGIHQNTDNIHIHFILNTVSYIDGKLFSEGIFEFKKFKLYVNQVIGMYVPAVKECSKEEFFQDNQEWM